MTLKKIPINTTNCDTRRIITNTPIRMLANVTCIKCHVPYVASKENMQVGS